MEEIEACPRLPRLVYKINLPLLLFDVDLSKLILAAELFALIWTVWFFYLRAMIDSGSKTPKRLVAG